MEDGKTEKARLVPAPEKDPAQIDLEREAVRAEWVRRLGELPAWATIQLHAAEGRVLRDLLEKPVVAVAPTPRLYRLKLEAKGRPDLSGLVVDELRRALAATSEGRVVVLGADEIRLLDSTLRAQRARIGFMEVEAAVYEAVRKQFDRHLVTDSDLPLVVSTHLARLWAFEDVVALLRGVEPEAIRELGKFYAPPARPVPPPPPPPPPPEPPEPLIPGSPFTPPAGAMAPERLQLFALRFRYAVRHHVRGGPDTKRLQAFSKEVARWEENVKSVTAEDYIPRSYTRHMQFWRAHSLPRRSFVELVSKITGISLEWLMQTPGPEGKPGSGHGADGRFHCAACDFAGNYPAHLLYHVEREHPLSAPAEPEPEAKEA